MPAGDGAAAARPTFYTGASLGDVWQQFTSGHAAAATPTAVHGAASASVSVAPGANATLTVVSHKTRPAGQNDGLESILPSVALVRMDRAAK